MTGWDELKSNVIDKGNCCLCGTCIGVCPVQKPLFSNEGIVEGNNTCISCRRCLSSCPGNGFDFRDENAALFDTSVSEDHNLFGCYKKILKGYSNYSTIRENASSGGVLTAMSCYLLEKKMIDYVVGVVTYGTECRVKALHSVDEVMQAAQSKYIFVPVNSVLQHIRENEGRYLYIGLPCQIEGLRKAAKTDPLIRERVFLCAGLFCGFNLSRQATDFLIKKSGIKKERITKLEYRGKIEDKTGFKLSSQEGKFFISKHGYTILNAVYSRERCWKCYDYTAEFSDISFGDAWEEENGWSRIIIRTEKAGKIIEELAENKIITLKPSSAEDILKTQKTIVNYKKRDIVVRRNLLKEFPDYHVEYQKINSIAWLKAAMFLAALKFGQTAICRKMLEVLPIRWLEKISEDMRSGKIAEILRYLFWGIMTTVVNLLCFWGFQQLGADYRVSNLLTIVITKIAAFLFNKFFVFRTSVKTLAGVLKEILLFMLTRGTAGLIDYFGLILLVDYLHVDGLFGKFIMIIIVTIMNYFFGKHIVYKK